MRTAEAIMKKQWVFNYDSIVKYNPELIKAIHSAINEGRKECILECAEIAKCDSHYLEKSEVYMCAHKVNKESILSLIKELK